MIKMVCAAILGTSLALSGAAHALADTDSIATWGDSNLGGSVGTTGGSASLAGVTATVDGIGTFNGSLSVSGYGYSSVVNQSYSTSGIETHWMGKTPTSTFTGDGEIKLYDSELEIEATFTGPGYTLVCDPVCHAQ